MYSVLIVLGVLVMIYFLLTLIVLVSYYILLKYPHSKLSGWIRRHIITDVDLEP
jgi:hypothetical protein